MADKLTNSQAPLCQVCKVRPAIRAHLIPAGFVREINVVPKSDEKHMLVHNPTSTKEASNTGRFEKDLLCWTCDGILGNYENSALHLLRRLRRIEIGKKFGSQCIIREGSYAFRVANIDEFIRFACGILWKYASIAPTHPSFIDIGPYRGKCEAVCFHDAKIPSDIDVFIERDLFSYGSFPNPFDVYYYCSPSTGMRADQYMSWFSVGAFTIYIKLDSGKLSTFAPKRCWMKGRKRCFFNVDNRSIETNSSIYQSVELATKDINNLNKKTVPRTR